MPLLNRSARALFIGLSALILAIAAPLLLVQEARRDTLHALCGIVFVLSGIFMMFRLAARQRDASAPREAGVGAVFILLGCGTLASRFGVRMGFLAGGLLMLACIFLRRSDRWLAGSD
jgi:uncharacterized membrane protein YfcA